jgi:hypothetical protein
MANTTWNPSDKTANTTLTGSNLIATSAAGGTNGVRAIDKQVTGKFYWEYTCNVFANVGSGVGITTGTTSLTTAINTLTPACGVRQQSGQVYLDGNIVSGVFIGTPTAGTVICLALDCTARLVWFRSGAAGNWNGSASANPATGTGGVSIVSLGVAIPIYPWVSIVATSEQITANFGGSAFTGAVPSGFTSGFTAGVTSSTNALATQAALEQWVAPNPDAQVTQAAVEMWATTSSTTGQALATLAALEMWAKVDAAVAAGRAKAWNGSAWVAKPAKTWSGSAWVVKPVKIWNGSAWV